MRIVGGMLLILAWEGKQDWRRGKVKVPRPQTGRSFFKKGGRYWRGLMILGPGERGHIKSIVQ